MAHAPSPKTLSLSSQESPSTPPSPLSPRTSREQRETSSSASGYFPGSGNPQLRRIDEHKDVSVSSRSGSVASIAFTPARKSSGVSFATSSDSGRLKGRTRSPPPVQRKFEDHVAFDNIIPGWEPTERNPPAVTLRAEHPGYQWGRHSRTFMVGIDSNPYSDQALQWMLDELVDDGDEVVCLRVLEDQKPATKAAAHKRYYSEATALMDQIQARNEDHDKSLRFVVELVFGKLHSIFMTMIKTHEPALLIVGTKGRSLNGVQGLLNKRNSFSTWCLQYSPIPVVVVREAEKREKKKLKRAQNASATGYMQMLRDAGIKQHESLLKPDYTAVKDGLVSVNAPLQEAHAVATALGLPAAFDPTVPLIDIEDRLRGRRRTTDGGSRSRETSQDMSARRSGSRSLSPSGDSVTRKSLSVSDAEDGSDAEDEESMRFDLELGDHEDDPVAVEARQKQKKLHDMEVGEAAALAAGRNRTDSINSMDSNISNSGNDQG